jgi:hypothetical protein
LLFEYGTRLDDPERLLEGEGTQTRYLSMSEVTSDWPTPSATSFETPWLNASSVAERDGAPAPLNAAAAPLRRGGATSFCPRGAVT